MSPMDGRDELRGRFTRWIVITAEHAQKNYLRAEKKQLQRLLPIRKHREERENGIASAVPFSHFSIDAVTFDISKAPMPL